VSTASRDSLLTPAFVALTIAELLYFTAAGVLLAATPLFARDDLRAGETAIGIALGAFSASTLLLRPFAGRWSDRHGRRPLLIGGVMLFAVVVLGHLLVHSIAALVVLRLLLGTAEAAFFVASFAALADLAPPGRTGEALSLNSLALYLGIATGPGLAQVAIQLGGFRGAWLTAAALAAVACLLATRVPETNSDTSGDAGLLLHPAALGPGAALAAGLAASAAFLGFGVLHARDVGLVPWALAPLTFGATVVILRVALRTLPDRSDPRRLTAMALVVNAAGLLVLGAWATPAGVIAGALLLGLGTTLITPAVFATVLSRVPPSERGSAVATTSLFIDVGLTGGPVGIGVVAAYAGVSGGFAWWALLPAVAAVLVAGPHRRRAS
jgi:MFS family permease